MSAPLVRIQIDGREVEARAGEMLIAVADREGVHIPRFCYHHRLAVAANCRMCLVEVAGARGPAPACATPVVDGMEVQTQSDTAKDAQRSTMEFLLLNHPLDCPICDQGGECELQDTALEHGRAMARTDEARRVVPDPDLGPLVSTDMTRCIHCTRCVRFTEEIAGEPELGAFGRGEFMKIGTYVQKALASELSGCVIDLCPVGALNAKPSRMRARAWEMAQCASSGEHDGIVSSLYHHTLRGRIVRTVPREDDDVNLSWLADRDRFSYQAAQHPERLTAPMARIEGRWTVISWDEAHARVAEALQRATHTTGLIHPSSTVEECALFAELLRATGDATDEHRLRMSDFRHSEQYPRTPDLGGTLEALEQDKVVVLIGAFPRFDQPIFGLRLRQAALAGTQVISIEAAPNDWNFPLTVHTTVPEKWIDKLGADDIAKALKAADGAARIVLGPMAQAHPDASLLYAQAQNVAQATGATLGVAAEGANAAGAWLAGCVATRDGNGAAVAAPDLTAAMETDNATWVLYGAEPDCDVADPAALRRALDRADRVIGMQAFKPRDDAWPFDLLLPLPTIGERTGHVLSLEGRFHTLKQAAPLPQGMQSGTEILSAIAAQANVALPWRDSAALMTDMRERAAQTFTPATVDTADAERRCTGGGLERIGTTAIYQLDAVTRHAHALQQTELAAPIVAVHPDTLRANDCAGADRVRLMQNGASVVLAVRADARVPKHCVYVTAGSAQLAPLGATYGSVRISHA